MAVITQTLKKGLSNVILCRISSGVVVEPLFSPLVCVTNIKAEFIGTQYYSRTNNIFPDAFGKSALAGVVVRFIGNVEVPGIEVASVSD